MKYVIYRLYTILREHEEGCNFFDNFGLFIQSILGAIAFSFLILKRYIEKPRREWKIWALDTSKQCAGQLTQHFFNLFISAHIGNKNNLECEWYIINLINDTSIGLLVQYIILCIITCILKNTRFKFESGDYGHDISGKYFLQLFIWIVIVLLVIFIDIGESNKYYTFSIFFNICRKDWKFYFISF